MGGDLVLGFDDRQFGLGLPIERQVEIARKDLPARAVFELDNVAFGMGADLHQAASRVRCGSRCTDGRRSRPASSPWHLGHLNRISGCADDVDRRFAAMGQAPQRGHFSKRVSVSIIVTAPPKHAPVAANGLEWRRFPPRRLSIKDLSAVSRPSSSTG